MFKLHQKMPNLSFAAIATLGVIVAGLTNVGPIDHAAAQATKNAQSALAGQKVFSTPAMASKELVEALKNNDETALLAIFGQEYKNIIITKDKAGTRANRIKAYQAAQELLVWRKSGDETRTLVIGNEAWPMPIPLIKAGAGWRFDTPAGIEEIVNRRIGENELSAIDVSAAYVKGQKQFAGKDRDGDRVLEYAQNIKSSKGAHDGLYWEAKAGEELSPFGPLVSEQQDYLKDRNPGDPFKGYYFKILTRQGEKAPGGRFDYVINGNMIAGFAMAAFPADYGVSGIMTFIVSHHGRVYQKDIGPNSLLLGRALQVFDPDQTWVEVKN